MKILILGSKGMLGSDCKTLLSAEFDVVAPDKKDLDIVSWDCVIEEMSRIHPDVVLNCAAFTDVDACEKEKYRVRKANVEGPRNLAQGSARFNCKLIHISSDYVFNGQKSVPQPYFEDDTMGPISAYGKSKMESEVAVRENAPNYVILRSGWLYGVNGANFIASILAQVLRKKQKKVQVVDDQFGSPTWTFRLAQQIRELIKSDARGTYHATAEGYCSRFEWARHVFAKLKIKATVEPARSRDYPLPAKRPANCILENRLLKKQGLNFMASWDEDLDLFLDRCGEQMIKQAKSKKGT